MRKGQIFVIFALFFAIFGQSSAKAQGKTTILVGANAHLGDIKSPGGNNFLAAFETTGKLAPAVELRFRQNKVLGFGVEYVHNTKLERPREVINIQGENGQTIAGYTLSGDAKVNFLLGNINLSTSRGKARPFLSLGAGLAQTEVTNRVSDGFVVTGLYEDSPRMKMFQKQIATAPVAGATTEKSVGLAVKAMVGMNFFPHKNFLISFGGGYLNGPAANLKVGVTF